ncbi:MAG: hypothetical protein JJ862_03495 [Roseivirga sp.]|uniref:hypothetical protein n=1 Tax=Roseivirga sp. TaxID=1964215 RepID=UPI001B22594B|nr:hypothetical protein [Roseivirga sp.]MBO6659932.1 hypothetical protein [Roseivirga sp.]MBO6907331.1 hypothetical protein [Roseivirga sp.]
MIKRLLFLGLLFCTFMAQGQSEDVQKELQNRYLGYLIREGYDPEIDADGDVEFTYNDNNYYLTIDESEKEFFRIARIARLELTEESDINRVKIICHDITKEKKVTKVYWFNNNIWVSSELLFSDSDGFEGIFERAMELTEKSFDEFVTQWKEN